MSIDWDKLDSSIFEDYFASLKDDDCSPPPPFAEHVSILFPLLSPRSLARQQFVLTQAPSLLSALCSPLV